MKFSYSNILGQSCKLRFRTELILVHAWAQALHASVFLGFSTGFNLVKKFLVRNRTNLNAYENFPLFSTNIHCGQSFNIRGWCIVTNNSLCTDPSIGCGRHGQFLVTMWNVLLTIVQSKNKQPTTHSNLPTSRMLHKVLPHGEKLLSLIFVPDWMEHTIYRTQQCQRCQTPDNNQQPDIVHSSLTGTKMRLKSLSPCGRILHNVLEASQR